MPAAIDNQKFKYDNSAWTLITQYLLSEDDRDEGKGVKLDIGSLSQSMHALGLPPEGLGKIEGTVTRIVREARKHFLNARPNLPIHIRLYCQRILLNGLPYSEKQMHGGWGCYIIERGGDFPCPVCYKNHRVVELYLYKEGINST